MPKEIDKLAWLYIKDGKLLLARSKDKALFYIPGGKREEGESDTEALVREIKEEVSVNLVLNSIKYAGTFTALADGKDNVMVKLTCYFADYEGELSPDAEIEQVEFISYHDKSQCSVASIAVMDWLYEQQLLT